MSDITVLSPIACIECGKPLPSEGPGAVLYLEVGGQTVAVPELQRCDGCTNLIAAGRLTSNLDANTAVDYLGGAFIPASLTFLQTRRNVKSELVSFVQESVRTAIASLETLIQAGFTGQLTDVQIRGVDDPQSMTKAVADSIGVNAAGETVYVCPGCGNEHLLSDLPEEVQTWLLTYNTGDDPA